MLWFAVHTSADITNIREYRFLVAVSVDGWWCESVPFRRRRGERGILCVKKAEETGKELWNVIVSSMSNHV
jgi:hypothetical protein